MNNKKILIESRSQRKIEKKQFLYFMYLIMIRYITNYANIIFSFAFPIVWLICGYYIWAKQAGSYATEYYLSFYTSYSLMPAASLGIMALAITFGADRINNMNKIYAILNVSPTKYFIANYITVFIQFFIVSNIILLVGNFGFMKMLPNGNQFFLAPAKYFFLLFTGLYTFTICFIFSIGLSLVGKRYATLYLSLLVYYYINLFLSGTMIPVYTFDPNGFLDPSKNWFKWIQYMFPLGVGSRLNWNIINPYFWTWNSDWLVFVSPILQAFCICLIIWKHKSIWRYHKDIDISKKRKIFSTKHL